MKHINLKRCRKQLDIADWAIGGMESLPEDDQLDLWGKVYEGTPVKLINGVLTFEDNIEVVNDFIFRIEDQYLQMAEAEIGHEWWGKKVNFVNEERAVYELVNKCETLTCETR